MPTAWIFGALMISMGLVILGILVLRKKRNENLAKADESEMQWEDAMT